MPVTRNIPLDLFVCILIVPTHIQRGGVDFLLAIALMLYIGIELWQPITFLTELPSEFNRPRFAFLARLFLLFIMITAAFLLPAVGRIQNRIETGVDEIGFSPAFKEMHDGALQVESALDFLIDGKNPYAEEYGETPMRFFGFSFKGKAMEDNPYLHYFPYLPGILLISTPFHALSQGLNLFYDQRIVYLSAYILLVFLLPLLAKTPTIKLLLVAAVSLNPLLVGFTIMGMNDVLLAVILVATVILMMNSRYTLSAVSLGVAIVIKQFAWFLLPFYLVWLFGSVPRAERAKHIQRTLVILAVIGLLVIGPFAVWDFSAFWTDVFAYPSGGVEVNYPIRGYTLGNLLVGAGMIGSPLDPFPFWILQLFLGLPVLVLLIQYQLRQNTIGRMLICYGLFVLVFGFLSRFFQENYLGFVTIIITIGLILGLETKQKDPTPAFLGNP